MDKTIIVIGDVAEEKYREVRGDILARGDQPHVRKLESLNQFMPSQDELLQRISDDPQSGDAPASELDWYFMKFMREHLEGFGYIGAIVMDRSTWDKWREGYHTSMYEVCVLGSYPLVRYVIQADASSLELVDK